MAKHKMSFLKQYKGEMLRFVIVLVLLFKIYKWLTSLTMLDVLEFMLRVWDFVRRWSYG